MVQGYIIYGLAMCPPVEVKDMHVHLHIYIYIYIYIYIVLSRNNYW